MGDKIDMKKIIMICIVLLTGLTSCSNYKIVTYYIGNGAMQYFVPPIEYSSGNMDAFVDFTYRNTDIENPEIACNFSVILDEDDQLIKFDKAGFIVSVGERILLDSLSVIFVDHGALKIRYSSKITCFALWRTVSGTDMLCCRHNLNFLSSSRLFVVSMPPSPVVSTFRG